MGVGVPSPSALPFRGLLAAGFLPFLAPLPFVVPAPPLAGGSVPSVRAVPSVVDDLLDGLDGLAGLAGFGGGLSPLPAWVRHRNRVWLWTSAKLLINAERIMIHKGVAA